VYIVLQAIDEARSPLPLRLRYRNYTAKRVRFCHLYQ